VTAAPPNLPVLILAAGFSSRLGRPKALARVRSISLLRRTLLMAVRLAPSVIVVLPERAARYKLEARGLKVIFVANARRAEGLSSSVRRGIWRARFSAGLLLLPVDLAALQTREIARLILRWRAARRRVVARRTGERGRMAHGGVPLIVPRWLYGRALQVKGDIGLRDLVGDLAAEQKLLLALPSAGFDVDTAQDLRVARRRFGAAVTP
jgi:molybdenum cofactor cytidylyltransferase